MSCASLTVNRGSLDTFSIAQFDLAFTKPCCVKAVNCPLKPCCESTVHTLRVHLFHQTTHTMHSAPQASQHCAPCGASFTVSYRVCLSSPSSKPICRPAGSPSRPARWAGGAPPSHSGPQPLFWLPCVWLLCVWMPCRCIRQTPLQLAPALGRCFWLLLFGFFWW